MSLRPPGGWQDQVVVAIPTVPQRRAALRDTLAQWEKLGATVHVEEQPADDSVCHESQRRTASRAIIAAHRQHPDRSHLLLCEDDVDLSTCAGPVLDQLLTGVHADQVVALYTNRLMFYPPDVRARAEAGLPFDGHRTVPARNVSGWYGGLCVLLPVADALDVICHPITRRGGWDTLLQRWCVAQRRGIRLALPSVAQHRGLPSTTGCRSGQARSITYQDGSSCAAH